MVYVENTMSAEKMQLTHKIALCPTPEQIDYFQRACGTARRVWNWALAEWNRQYEAGRRPNGRALNLKRLATETALTVASPFGNGGTTTEQVSAVVGEVTPVRHEVGPQGASGQEENRAHHRASS